MEFRKLIGFGKSSLVISLPKTWVNSNKLKKGSVVYLNVKKDNISVYPRETKQKTEQKEVTIDVNGKNIDTIQREIMSSYINGCTKIIITGKRLGRIIKDIRNILNNLAAIEIIEQTTDKIVVKDFLDMNDVSIDEIIRKIDITLRSMFSEFKEVNNDVSAKILYDRDNDLNKLVFLVFKVIKNFLIHENFSKIKPVKLLNYWVIVNNLEKIADEIKRIARFCGAIRLTSDERNFLINIFTSIEKKYLETMRAYYTGNKELAFKSADSKKRLMGLCEQFYRRYGNKPLRSNTVEKLRNMIVSVHNITRIVYENV